MVILCQAFAASAQENRNKLNEDQKKALKSIVEANKSELKLTGDQSKKFDSINLKFVEALSDLKEDNSSRLGKFRQLKAITKERNKQIKQLLSTEQYKIFNANQAELKAELKARRQKH